MNLKNFKSEKYTNNNNTNIKKIKLKQYINSNIQITH